MKRFNVLPVILLCASILTLTACQSTQTNSPSDPSSAQSTVSEDPGGESSKLPDEDVSSAGSNTEQKDFWNISPVPFSLYPKSKTTMNLNANTELHIIEFGESLQSA